MTMLVEYSPNGERKQRIEYALAETGTSDGDRAIAIRLVMSLRRNGSPDASVWGDGSLITPTEEEENAYDTRVSIILAKEKSTRMETIRKGQVALERAEREARRAESWKEKSDGCGNVGTDVGSDQQAVCGEVDEDGGSGESDPRNDVSTEI